MLTDYVYISYIPLQYVLLYTYENCDPVNQVYYCDLSALPDWVEGCKGRNELLPFIKLVDNFVASYEYVANDGSALTFRTNKDAPKYKLVRVDLKEPDSWSDIIQENEKDVLESAVVVNNNQLVVNYLSDVKNVLQLRDLKAGALLHHLPIDIGSVSGISARRKDDTFFIGFTNFLIPGIIYECNLNEEVPNLKVFRETVVPGFDHTDFQVNQVNEDFLSQLCLFFSFFLTMLELVFLFSFFYQHLIQAIVGTSDPFYK